MLFTKHGYLQLTDDLGNVQFVTDITKKIVIPEYFKNSKNFQPFLILDGDTPESIAYDLYGDQKLSWIIILTNNIKNVYEDWPLSSTAFEQMLERKYGNDISLFLYPDTVKRYDMQIGSKIKVDNIIKGTVKNWNPSLFKLTVTPEVNHIFKKKDIIKNNDGNEIGEIGRIVNYERESLHHFERDGIWVDPLIGYLQSFIYTNKDDYVITNNQYETNINDKKRNIFVPEASIARKIQTDYSTLMS